MASTPAQRLAAARAALEQALSGTAAGRAAETRSGPGERGFSASERAPAAGGGRSRGGRAALEAGDAREAAGRTRERPPLDAQRLHALAVRYLERFDAPAVQLRRVLGRHVARERGRLSPVEVSALEAAADALVARLASSGAIDDQRFAEGVARGQRARGGSARAIQARLAQRGVPREVGAAALAQADRDDSEAELTAARALARRRRLGVHRADAEERVARAERDLGVLARAGFSHAVARRALAADDDGE